MSTYLPPIGLIVLSILFSAARFENGRWIRARRGGQMGASRIVGYFIDTTGAVSLLFAVGFLAADGYDEGFIKALVLVGICAVAGLVISGIIFTLIFKGDSVFYGYSAL